MNKPWYKEWFNSPYYHLLYRHRDNDEAKFFLNNLTKALHLTPAHHILDLACGRGRHSIYLNSLGFEVTGLDLSEANISYASQFQNERLHFAIHDMKEVYKNQAFDVILNLFTSFGYFKTDEENQQVISSVFKMLKPGGLFVIDYLNTQSIKYDEGIKEFEIDGVLFRIRKYLEIDRIIKEIEVKDGKNHSIFQEKVKNYTAQDLCKMIECTGMKILHLFGNYQLTTFDPAHSDRIIIVSSR
ncbi:MAG: class I SAM-dependent methyltransferase [Flavobacteriales bacterium]|nr:class I SAM-dependent methyltransferase [Flavobacteriales bacterium]